MRHVLVIAYYFPPVAGGGVQRTAKLVKYLPACGWQPWVLTVREAYDYYSDPAMLADIPPGVAVQRTRAIEPMKWVRRRLKSTADARSQLASGRVISQGGVVKRRWLLNLKELIFAPDGEIGWLPFAVSAGRALLSRAPIDLIYSTSCPYTAHLIALALKRSSGKPWVADFRDPWSEHLGASKILWRPRLDRYLERRVLASADHVVTATSSMARDFARLCPSGRYTTVTNGYDEDDFQAPPDDSLRSPKLTLTHTGILFRERSPRNFLLALRDHLAEHPADRAQILVRFVGQMDNPGEVANYRLLAELGLPDVVEVVPYVSHAGSIAHDLAADALLLFVNRTPGSNVVLTGKIFEYLRAGRPILAIVPPEGEAAALIRETRAGIVADPDSRAEIRAALQRVIEEHRRGALAGLRGAADISRFERGAQARRMARLFDELCGAASVEGK